MNDDCLKLATYFGERDRAHGRLLSDAFVDVYARHELHTSLVLRGVEGFGAKQHLRSDRLLTLSEDLPLVSVAVDSRTRIEAALSELSRLRFDGLITLERARMLSASDVTPGARHDWHEETKLTIYVGRHERTNGRPLWYAIVALLHRHSVAGATVLLGIDGTAAGKRRRARFFARNTHVPVMVVAVGNGRTIGELLPELGSMLAQPTITVERVRVCKRDGELLARPHELRGTDASGLGIWQQLTVYVGEQSRAGAHPIYHQLVRALREAGAAGVTVLRGIWGYHGSHAPHGDSFWQLRRHVPVLAVVVDTPERIGSWFDVVDELTQSTGLVTSETVPALRVTAPDLERGGFELAQSPRLRD